MADISTEETHIKHVHIFCCLIIRQSWNIDLLTF